MSPSAKLVYLVLQEEGPCTQTDLEELTHLPERTVRDALTRLEEAELVTHQPRPIDARQKIYAIVDT